MFILCFYIITKYILSLTQATFLSVSHKQIAFLAKNNNPETNTSSVVPAVASATISTTCCVMWSPEYSRPPQDQNKLEPTKECLHFKWPLRALFRGCLELPERPNAPLHAQVARSVTSVAVICTLIPELFKPHRLLLLIFYLLIFIIEYYFEIWNILTFMIS